MIMANHFQILFHFKGCNNSSNQSIFEIERVGIAESCAKRSFSMVFLDDTELILSPLTLED